MRKNPNTLLQKKLICEYLKPQLISYGELELMKLKNVYPDVTAFYRKFYQDEQIIF